MVKCRTYHNSQTNTWNAVLTIHLQLWMAISSVQRFEILFGLFNAIFLLFIGMNMLKESLEHLMLEDDHHGGDHGA